MTNDCKLPTQFGGKFELGDLYLTGAAWETLSSDAVVGGLTRHAHGDWGEVSDEDRAANEDGLANDGRLHSVYRDERGNEFWVVTEWNRCKTTVLLPEDC